MKWYQSRLLSTSKLHELVAQISMVSTPITLPFLFETAPMASWGVSQDHLSEEQKICSWL